MVLIKRVMLAAAMSLLSEGAIAGEAVLSPPDRDAVAQQTQAAQPPLADDAVAAETR